MVLEFLEKEDPNMKTLQLRMKRIKMKLFNLIAKLFNLFNFLNLDDHKDEKRFI